MCIALISTAHPRYRLILLNNRDEYLRRPTAAAEWWAAPNSHVLGSRDLAREVQGTWMGVTKQGRLAVLTNYRENTPATIVGLRSRGSIINGFLALPPDDHTTAQQYIKDLVAGGEGQAAGGFSLACGDVLGPLGIVSNRASASDEIPWIATGRNQTVGLSNTAFGDRTWPKILDGERLLKEALQKSYARQENESELIERLLALLSTDTLPRLHDRATMEEYTPFLSESIFIPAVGDPDEGVEAVVSHGAEAHTLYMKGLYGTQKQTVILVEEPGRVKFFERTLYGDDAKEVPVGKGDREYEFVVERAGESESQAKAHL
ncbi:Ser/Thr-rich protein T10 in DGCR region [Nannizzia gypsea CBS 118893]|uniref:Ser/Thr-rich protein T10 in DGCR region n=1 Tax=Arthroderma gypseum (strain ATCC MYA-4604 / CBS 118893) TaxID=535722 RepID=E4V540_ARTGP|nr:Ser/Thr-rich protein T10 in DGCR region [Nannizzia gypsea CBS 118893]EFR05114.1 Ser/Thr-rich protein T10 in DGCR region [Nannizzia gypsea CBS 118893]